MADLMPKPSLHDLSFQELENELDAAGISKSHARTLFGATHRLAERHLLDRTDFPPPLQRWLLTHAAPGKRLAPERLEITSEIPSTDGLTHKFLLKLRDGQTVETVAMGYPGRFTACLSTQAGCAMGCVFCATGQMGFVRHLRPGEIVAQALVAQRHLRASGHSGLRNLVLMGMGEPLHNYDAVMQALEILCDTRGMNLGPSRISISTVGLVPAIRRMAEEKRPYHLAVSLHAASDAERSALLPVNQRWPLADLLDACRFYNTETGQRIFFGWTLIEGTNDSSEHATRLADLLKGIDAHVNLIPLNPTPAFGGLPPEDQAARAFQKILRTAGIPSTIRQRRGIDVDAGCGQLRAERRPAKSCSPA
jgi:23S rRNA (adenine2503-C2)-methyltransferase